MLSKIELEDLANNRLEDANVLMIANRFDAAVYLCGYAVELGLKHRICKTLDWEGFPSTTREFENFKSFKVHNLNVLLNLSGYERKIKTEYVEEWSIVNTWNPESRYTLAENLDRETVEEMISATTKLLEIL
jgi:HEPN domain-containing protein